MDQGPLVAGEGGAEGVEVEVVLHEVDRRLGTMKVGDVIDDFTATDQQGNEVSLSSLVEAGPVVLFFYPKAMTPG
jgi:hypothetical protein